MSFFTLTRDFLTQPRFKQTFIFGVLVYCIALFALVRGDVYYIDDWGHSTNPKTAWDHFSRFVGTALMHAVNLKPIVVDLSPLTQLIAVLFLVLGGMILNFAVRKKLDYIGVLAAIPLGLSPHFLENLSYKLDSTFMSFAVLCCIVPFLFRERLVAFFTSSVVCLILMYCSYQASNGIYIVLGLYFALSLYFFDKKSVKQALGFLFVCIGAFALASLIYKKWIVTPIDWGYASDSMIPLSNLLNGGGAILKNT